MQTLSRILLFSLLYAPGHRVFAQVPSITTQPQNQTASFGQAATFNVAVTGAVPLNVQWRLDGADLAGATDTNLVIAASGDDEAGSYDVVVSNPEGSVTSATVSLTVNVAPIAPQAQGLLAGKTARFTSGQAADSYQWRKQGVLLAGATAAELVITNLASGDAGAYDVMLTSGTATTLVTATLGVLDPTNHSYYALHVLDDAPRGYWRLGEAAGISTLDETGIHHGTYVNAPVLADAGALLDDADTAVRFIQAQQTKAEIPYSPDLNTASFTVECWAQLTGGSGHRSPLTSRDDPPQEGFIFYVEPDGRWDFWTGPGWHQMNTATPAANNTWQHLVGTYDATTRTKRFYIDGQLVRSVGNVNVNPNNQRVLRIGAGATNQDPGAFFFAGLIDEVAVYPQALAESQVRTHYLAGSYGPNTAPEISTQPQGAIRALGDTNTVTTFSAVVEGSPPFFYQWNRDGAPLAGATNTTLVIPAEAPPIGGAYTLRISNQAGAVTSQVANLTFTGPDPLPAAQTALEGTDAEIAVTLSPDSSGYTYQWYRATEPLVGATNATLVLADLTPGIDDAEYFVEVTLGADRVLSGPAALAVVPVAAETYAQVIAGQGPLIWWRLGETNGATIAVDQVSTNDAVIEAGAVLGAADALLGDSDTAADLPGTAGQKIMLTNAVDAATAQWTVSFWALPAGGTGLRSPVTSRIVSTNGLTGWSFYLNGNDRWQLQVGDGGNAWAGNVTGPTATIGRWAYVAGSYDGDNLRLYVDGQMMAEQAGVTYTPQSTVPLFMGAGESEEGPAGGGFYWNGRLDEVALFDRALSAGEITEQWAAAFQTNAPPEFLAGPEPHCAAPGATVVFDATVHGTPPLSYQWQKDGADLPGADGLPLTLEAVTASDAGDYRLVASNLGGSVTSTVANLFVPAPLVGTYRDLILAGNPVAYWPLDETEGLVAVDIISTNHGDIMNGPVLGEPGAVVVDGGTSYTFSQAATQKIEIPYSPTVNPATNFSIECWARMDGGTSHRSPFTSRDDLPQAGYIFYCQPNNSWEFWTGTGVQANWNLLNWGQGAVSLGQWYHLVGTYDGSTMSFYVDGALVGSRPAAFAPNPRRPTRIAAGSTDSNPGNFFMEGGVDEVVIYDYALDPKQVLTHYAGGLESPRLALWAERVGDEIRVHWEGAGVLQHAVNLDGTLQWSDVPGNPGSPYVLAVPASGARVYFRLREP